ncbi:hypothetical protein [Rhodobacter lacus]|uniref:Uncharacterized protein n=1 Tax=Rhodobacter lacus TaxID=1641972 RepID=A0ABW5ACA4_9RHOB
MTALVALMLGLVASGLLWPEGLFGALAGTGARFGAGTGAGGGPDQVITTYDGRRIRVAALGCLEIEIQARIETEWRRAFGAESARPGLLRPASEPGFAALAAAHCAR